MSLPTVYSLKKKKVMYKVLTPGIKPPYINSYELTGILWAHLDAIGGIGLNACIVCRIINPRPLRRVRV